MALPRTLLFACSSLLLPSLLLAQGSGGPPIQIRGQTFQSWSQFTSSPMFKDEGLRCGAPGHDASSAAAFALVASDCAYGSTNPTQEYEANFVYEIPVVVHVIKNNSGQGNISMQMVQSQIDILNEDFRALPGSLGANGFDTKIQFRLASVDPQGNPTSGVTYSTNNTWFNDGGQYWNSLAWDPNRYMNIYTNKASGALGYVPDIPQGGLVGNKNDRVVVLWSSFGRNAPIGAPFNQGRTATHEVGHYLGLYHTFDGGCASAQNCYSNGDRICDTNPESSPNNGCGPGSSSCGTPDPVRNYMDYSDDTCMWEFTSEQSRRMRCTLQHWRPLLADVQQNCNPSYGSGCAGAGGNVPSLSVSGCAAPGAQLSVSIDNAYGGANAFLFLGLNEAALPMGSGCTLNVAPLLPLVLGPLPLAGVGSGNGQLSFSSTVSASATPGTVRLQAFVDDPFAVAGFSNSNGVTVNIQ